MKTRIFISSVSKELKTSRQLIANTLVALGFEPVWKDIFETEAEDIRPMLRRKIDSCSGVFQIIGEAFGSEPPEPDKTFGRVSYTQYEAFYAASKGKKVFYLIADTSFPRDASASEIDVAMNDSSEAHEDVAERARLQSSYRQQIESGEHIHYAVCNEMEAELCVRRLKDDLSKLRRGFKYWMAGISITMLLIAALVLYVSFTQHGIEKNTATISNNTVVILDETGEISNQLDREKESEAEERASYFAAVEESKRKLDTFFGIYPLQLLFPENKQARKMDLDFTQAHVLISELQRNVELVDDKFPATVHTPEESARYLRAVATLSLSRATIEHLSLLSDYDPAWHRLFNHQYSENPNNFLHSYHTYDKAFRAFEKLEEIEEQEAGIEKAKNRLRMGLVLAASQLALDQPIYEWRDFEKNEVALYDLSISVLEPISEEEGRLDVIEYLAAAYTARSLSQVHGFKPSKSFYDSLDDAESDRESAAKLMQRLPKSDNLEQIRGLLSQLEEAIPSLKKQVAELVK